MKAIARILAATAVLLGAAASGVATAAESVPRVALLSPAASADASRFAAFRKGLGEAGYQEGRSVTLEFKLAHGVYDRLAVLAAELVKSGVDVVVAESTDAALAARAASKTVPIVALVNSDPVRGGLVASLGRPGGNVTGIVVLAAELTEKRLDLLHEAFPQAKRVAALLRPPGTQMARALQSTGGRLGVAVETVAVRTPDELRQALRSSLFARVDGIVVSPQSLFRLERAEIVAAVAASRKPAIYPDREFIDAGGLLSYGTSLDEAFRRAALYVGRILKGAKPAELPMEQPSKIELIVNLRTARALGLAIPQSILARADEVVE